MKTIFWHLETSQQGSEWSGEFEVEDNTPDREI